MTSIFTALLNHLNRLTLPCYLADSVPQGAELPYLTADVRPPLLAGGEGSLTLTCWFTGDTANAQRLRQADQLAALFSSRGTHLSAGSGSLVIKPEGSASCITQHGLQGVTAGFSLQFFPCK